MDLRDVFLVISVLGVMPLALVKPQIGLLAWMWISIMNPHKETYGFMVTMPVLDGVAIATILGCLIHWGKRAACEFLPVLWVMLLFYLWCCLTTVFAVNPKGAVGDWIEFTKTLLLVFLMLQFMNKRHWTIALVAVFILSMSYTTIKGGVFTILTGGAHRVWGAPTSMWGDNNGVSLAMLMLAPMCVGFGLLFQRKALRWGVYGIGFLAIACVLGTQSRGGLVGLLAVAAAMALRSRQRAVALVLGPVILVAGFMFMPASWHDRMATILDPTAESSANARLIQWRYAIDISLERPFFGNGFEAFFYQPYYYRYVADKDINRAVHSNIFQVLGEQGFIGLAMYLALVAMLIILAHRYANRARGHPGLEWETLQLNMLQFTVVGYIANGLTLNLAYLDLFYYVMVIIALLISQVRAATGMTTARQLRRKAPRYGARPGYGPPGYPPRPGPPSMSSPRQPRQGRYG